jgi:hypothetical protein
MQLKYVHFSYGYSVASRIITAIIAVSTEAVLLRVTSVTQKK